MGTTRDDPVLEAKRLIRERDAIRKIVVTKKQFPPGSLTICCNFCDWTATWYGPSGSEPIVKAYAEHVKDVPLDHFDETNRKPPKEV